MCEVRTGILRTGRTTAISDSCATSTNETCEGRGQSDPLQADLTFWKERVDLSALYAFDVRIPMDVKTVDSITTSKVLSGIGAWQHCPGKSLYLWDTAQRLRQRAPGATRSRRGFEDELPHLIKSRSRSPLPQPTSRIILFSKGTHP